jgi:hypothetical protein
MVGIPAKRANSSTSLCAKVRKTAPLTIRPSTRAVSFISSPRPSWISFDERNIASPPNSRMPTSKDTRVRVEDLEKSIAHTCPCKGWFE